MKKIAKHYLPDELKSELGQDWFDSPPHKGDENVWSTRPLPHDAIKYASNDVHTIAHLYRLMIARTIPDDWIAKVYKESQRRLNEYRSREEELVRTPKNRYLFTTERYVTFPGATYHFVERLRQNNRYPRNNQNSINEDDQNGDN